MSVPVVESGLPPSVLYKFRAYDRKLPEQLGWVRDTLFRNRIRFSKMSELNDPFEGQPFVLPLFEDPEKQKAEVFRTSLDDAHRAGFTGRDAVREALIAVAAMRLPIGDVAIKRMMAEGVEESFWVYCVTATRDPILMWSHYADGHKGIALHFDPAHFPIQNLYEVHYDDEYPVYHYPSANALATHDAVRAILHTKATAWQYEREYRVVRVVESRSESDRVNREMGLNWDGQMVTLSDAALSGVTLGAAMPKALARELTAELADHRPAVEVWQAETALRTYSLDFVRVR